MELSQSGLRRTDPQPGGDGNHVLLRKAMPGMLSCRGEQEEVIKSVRIQRLEVEGGNRDGEVEIRISVQPLK